MDCREQGHGLGRLMPDASFSPPPPWLFEAPPLTVSVGIKVKPQEGSENLGPEEC